MTTDSTLKKWRYREHTRVKHILLEKYLAAWIPILGKFYPRICYLDGFAGRGEYTDEKTGEVVVLGSPIIGLRVANSLLERCEEKKREPYFGKFLCIAVEKDTGNFRNLRDVLQSEQKNIAFRDTIQFEPKNEEFATVAQNLLDEIVAGVAPIFSFIDPFGFKGVPFSVVNRILSKPKTEVFFTFMVRDMARFIEHPQLANTLTELFGTEEWTELVQMPDREKALIELYRKQLHKAAQVQYSWHFRVCESGKLRTLYYLIHATNNFRGHSIMKGIMYNQSAQGDFAYLGPQDIAQRSQMRLFDINDIGQLKGYLLEKFAGQTLTYDQVQESTCHPWYAEPPYIDKHFRQALKELEKEDKLKVQRTTSKTPRGLASKDRVIFGRRGNPIRGVTFPLSSRVSKIKVHYKEYGQSNGRNKLLVERVNDGSIVRRFDKTPLPRTRTHVVCPHFLELKWAYGCPYDCAWCYLKGTFRFQPKGKLPVVKPYEKIELHTRKFLEEVRTPEILNTGEIADSLMHENAEVPFSKFIIPIFEGQELHKVLFLTKSSNVENLLEIEPHSQAIISFSLNAIPVAERWEKAPRVLRRIEAAKKVLDAGYEVRVRIDPMVPVENWQEYYVYLLSILFDNFTPERITLGSLRGLQSTINGCADKSWVKYLAESSNWGKKIDFKTRHLMYSTIIDQLKSEYSFTEVALCKETVEMWNALNMNYKKIKCNCVW
jgi:spore photoproduct lyase